MEQIRDRCEKKEVAFFFKQWGGVQKSKTGRHLAGRTWDDMPEGPDNTSPVRAVA